MSNPRSAAFAALREAEAREVEVPEVLTVQALQDIKAAMRGQLQALRRALEWMDAVETP